MAQSKEFILLPRHGFQSWAGASMNMLVNLPRPHDIDHPTTARLRITGRPQVLIKDSIFENGPKLVEMDVEDAEAVNSEVSPLRAEPLVNYNHPNPIPSPQGGPSTLSVQHNPVTIEVIDSQTGNPVEGARLVAFTDYQHKIGDEGYTDAIGTVTFQLSGGTIERLYCYPPPNYWGAYQTRLAIQPLIQIAIEPVDLSYIDCLRYYYAGSRFDASTGVKVAIIDTGAGPHKDLNIFAGTNAVTGEPHHQYDDLDGHGTHVAGITGAMGAPPSGLRGVAPGVPLSIFRVFNAQKVTTNYAILRAMLLAEQQQCDIVNLSLGGGPFDLIVSEAVQAARNAGMLVIVAAGNDHRKAVSYPAAYAGATAVSAMGREGSFPAGSLEESHVYRPPSSTVDADEFIAEFSNVGSQIAITAPGVGILSTLPNDAYGPLSGTSMAAPVISGIAACLLSRDLSLYGAPRGRTRSDIMEKLLFTSSAQHGFGLQYEGYGLPDPSKV